MTVSKENLNSNLKKILLHSVGAALGLALFGVGTYMTFQANIGVASWDCFFLGIEKTFGFKYGNISVCASFIIIVIDLLLKERIGIGTFLDAVVVGKTVDLLNYIDIIPEQTSIITGILLMLAGLLVNGIGQYIYMSMGLCCGPRDGLLLGLSKRLKKIPIGGVSVIIMAVAVGLGWILGGPIGLGTIIGTFLQGPIMQLVFMTRHFEAEQVEHQDVITSAKIISMKKTHKA